MNPLFHDRLNLALLSLVTARSCIRPCPLACRAAGPWRNSFGLQVSSPSLIALCLEIIRSLMKGEVGLDIVAALSMSAALLFGETLAAAVVALMYSGGTFLESFAQGRARREMSDLLSRVPRTATRHRNGALDEVPLDDDRSGRSASDPAGRRGTGGRNARQRKRDARSVSADGRIDARPAHQGSGCDERLDQCGRGL
jgi:hypothetical protein